MGTKQDIAYTHTRIQTYSTAQPIYYSNGLYKSEMLCFIMKCLEATASLEVHKPFGHPHAS